MEPLDVDDRSSSSCQRPPRGPQTGLRQTLKEHHVNAIGFNAVVGIGLFQSAGRILHLCGPGLAVIVYLVGASMMWAVMGCIGEPTSLYPVKGPVFEWIRRLVDSSVGLSASWVSYFGWMCVINAEILAITELFRFKVESEYLDLVEYPLEKVQWFDGKGPDPAAWVALTLLFLLLLNLLPSRQYAQIEYVIMCIKITFMATLIVTNVVIASRQDDGLWTWKNGLGFSTHSMTVWPQGSSELAVVYEGSKGVFLAFWTSLTISFFSLMGWEITLITAPENKDLDKAEITKISSRKIALRVTILYSLAVLTVGFIVPSNDPALEKAFRENVNGGQYSVFVLAALRGHVPFLPHFLVGFFIFSAFATGLNCLWSSSRILHAIACQPDAWPPWHVAESIRRRLEQTRYGVPVNAVFFTWLLCFISFMAQNQGPNLGRIIAASATCALIVYALNCIAFLSFFKEIAEIADGKKDAMMGISRELRFRYDRNAETYPWKSHGQWLRAVYGLVTFTLMIIFQGWRSFISKLDVPDFLASYISVFIFIALCTVYFFATRGFSPKDWEVHAVKLSSGLETVGPIVIDEPEKCVFCDLFHRRGELVHVLDQQDVPFRKKAKGFLEWLIVWGPS